MGRRIRWLGVVLAVCFAAVLVQLVNIQLRQATALNSSKANPRNAAKIYDNKRGLILAKTGKVLAESIRVPGASEYQYKRVYPTGTLFSGIVGYDSPYFYGTRGVESEYNNFLSLHTGKAQTLRQLLNPPGPTTDNVTLTVTPGLQSLAKHELASIPDGHKDGAVTVLNVKTGAILAMFSSPTFTNNPLATPTGKKDEAAGKLDFTTEDAEGFLPGDPMATFDTFAPGSTFKVVTTSAVYNLKTTLENFTFKVAGCTPKPGTPGAIPETNKQICNDANTPTAADPCGGTMLEMLPESCDPGYAELGLALGGTTLYRQAELFGFNQKPPVDLNATWVNKSNFPTPAELAPTGKLALPGVALSAFGQQTVTETDLQNAMVAEGIADTGAVMTPHVMDEIRNSTGGLVEKYQPTVYKQAETSQAAKSVNKLMQRVVTTPRGTAAGVGFPSSWHIAVKTGTAQAGVGATVTTDWMIGFAPAYDPVVAISVVAPEQPVTASGARIAGPIMKAMMAAALAAVPHAGSAPKTSTVTVIPPTTTIPPSTTTTVPPTTTTTAPPTTTTVTPPTTPTTPGAATSPGQATQTAAAVAGVRERRAAAHSVRSPP
jgi:penicillin-binding protein A